MATPVRRASLLFVIAAVFAMHAMVAMAPCTDPGRGGDLTAVGPVGGQWDQALAAAAYSVAGVPVLHPSDAGAPAAGRTVPQPGGSAGACLAVLLAGLVLGAGAAVLLSRRAGHGAPGAAPTGLPARRATGPPRPPDLHVLCLSRR